jgi:coenzyme F420-reducing hydrogenase delta subunit
MVGRTDGMPFPTQAQVNPSLCVSCGICMGACPSSTPFRRSADLKTGIDLPDYSLRELRERVMNVAAGLSGPARVLVLACEHGAAAGRPDGTVVLPCVAMAPPSLIDFILSRDLADAVAVAGCAESACYNRLGIKWTEQRFAGERDPYLRARVPRERLATIWASALAVKKMEAEIAAFAARLATLPPKRLRSPLPASAVSRPTMAREPAELRGDS